MGGDLFRCIWRRLLGQHNKLTSSPVARTFLITSKPDIYGIIQSRLNIFRGFFDEFLQKLNHHPRRFGGVCLADH